MDNREALGAFFSIMGTRDHPAAVEWRNSRQAGRPYQRRPGDPSGPGMAKMVPMQALPAILSRPLGEHAATQQRYCAACRRAPGQPDRFTCQHWPRSTVSPVT
jgi:hypothetical protein